MNDNSENQTPRDKWFFDSMVYRDLPTDPTPEIGRVLVTGASGYVGGRLAPQLLDRGYKVRIMVRKESLHYRKLWAGAEIVEADALNKDQLMKALEGVQVAYYLIHSLLLGVEEFERADMKAAANFREAAEKNRLKRIIYLGGLGDTKTSRSTHLRSRAMVAEELRAGPVPVTILRAAVVIGSGSASYEIVHHLVRRMRFFMVPLWAKNRCQPIGTRDLIKYLVGVLETPETSGKSFDVGGRDVLTYELMLKKFSEIIKKKVLFKHVAFSNIKTYSYVASLITPVPAQIIAGLFEGLKDEVVCRNEEIKKYVPFEPISYKEAIIRALTREEQDKVHTRWSDSYPRAHELAIKLHEMEYKPAFTTSYSILSDKHCSDIFYSVCRIGGKTGWFNSNWLWRARGLIDKILLGVGTARGRKSYANLEISDVIDFWRVEDIRQDKRVLLRAEMKLPGMAWLDFNIHAEEGKSRLSITAYFFTKTVLGKIYWYIFYPFHHFIFNDIIEQIVASSRKAHRE